MGKEDWGGLPNLDPDLSKNWGGLPDLDLDSPRLFWQISLKSRDKSRPNLDSPQLFSLKSG